MKRTALLPLVLASALSLAACSGDGDDSDTDAASEPTGSPTADASASSDPGIISPSLPAIPEFSVEPNGVISDISVDTCDTEPGPVEATGTATNSGNFARDIVIVVNWAVASTSDVLARGVTQVVDVPPGETRDWQVTAELAGDEQVSCVPTAYAGQLVE